MDEIKFRIALVKKGITQNKLAWLLGLHPQTLSNIVRGYRKPDQNLRKRLCAFLGVPEVEIFSNPSNLGGIS